MNLQKLKKSLVFQKQTSVLCANLDSLITGGKSVVRLEFPGVPPLPISYSAFPLRLPGLPPELSGEGRPRLAQLSLVSPLFGDYAFRHSMKGNQSLLQALPEYPSLVPLKVACCRFMLGLAYSILCKSRFSLPECRGIDQESLLLRLVPAQPPGGG